MIFLIGIFNGLGEIRAHKLRSLLTIVCVMLGVCSLVLVVGFLNGLFARWSIWEESSGYNQRIEIEQAQPPKAQESKKSLSPGRSLNDAIAIMNLAPHAHAVSATRTLNGTLVYRGVTTNAYVKGVTPGTAVVEKYDVDHGRFITDADVDHASPVIVLGSDAVKKLFKGHDDPLGQVVLINAIAFHVVGLLHDYQLDYNGYNALQEKNLFSFIPVSTIAQRLSGPGELDELVVQADSENNLTQLINSVDSIVTGTHRGIHDFSIDDPKQNLEEMRSMRRNFTLVGGGVGVITLLVGGIGIMNLMLASINERVREIGIRKALGAWNLDIFVQFLAEAMALSTLGGLVGVGFGVFVIRVLRHAMAGVNSESAAPPQLSIPAVLVGLGFSVVIGIVAGLYPAFKAAKLDPIEALRYE